MEEARKQKIPAKAPKQLKKVEIKKLKEKLKPKDFYKYISNKLKKGVLGLRMHKKEKARKPAEKKETKEEERIIQEQKPSLLERLSRKKPKSEFKKSEKLPEEKAKSEVQESTVFGRLFGKLVPNASEIHSVRWRVSPSRASHVTRTRSQLTEKKPLTEAEELEDSIRKLGLFKELEKGELGIKEEKKKPGIFSKLIKKVTEKTTPQEKIKEQKPEKKISETSETEKSQSFPWHRKSSGMRVSSNMRKLAFARLYHRTRSQLTGFSREGKKLEKFHKAFMEAKEAIGKNDIAKAKKLYAGTRNLYVDLSTDEKKEVYGELMELYNKLSGK